MAITDIAQSDFDAKVVNSQSPVLLDFYATWCGPCKLAEPVLEELSKVYDGRIIFYKVDVDKNPDLAKNYDVMSIPTTVLVKEGKEIGRQIGFAGKQGFEDLLAKGGV